MKRCAETRISDIVRCVPAHSRAYNKLPISSVLLVGNPYNQACRRSIQKFPNLPRRRHRDTVGRMLSAAHKGRCSYANLIAISVRWQDRTNRRKIHEPQNIYRLVSTLNSSTHSASAASLHTTSSWKRQDNLSDIAPKGELK